jgi:outer membrane receptor protein involved in Fe transport
VSWSTSYKSSALRTQANIDRWQDNLDYCAEGNDSCVSDPEKIAYQEYDAYFKHNVSVSYNIELENDSSVRIFGGVNNVFDDKGQFYIGGRGNYGSEYDAGRGRFLYLGAEAKF